MLCSLYLSTIKWHLCLFSNNEAVLAAGKVIYRLYEFTVLSLTYYYLMFCDTSVVSEYTSLVFRRFSSISSSVGCLSSHC